MNSDVDIQVIYRDEHMIALDKPTGLLAVPGKGPDKQDCLSARVQRQYPGALVVHRLDMDTSGLMLMALSTEAQRHLSRQFEKRQVDKTYIAVVFGRIDRDEGTVELSMRLDVDNRPYQIVDPVHGKHSKTHWHVIERFTDRTRVELKPVTGRSHQLRLHMQQLGQPILGDPLYAPVDVQAMADRLMLHAQAMCCYHPASGERLMLECECPF